MSENTPPELITIKEIEELCGICFSKREEIDQLEAQVKELNAELEGFKEKLLAFLTEFDKTSYDSAHGKITVKNIFSVSVPKTPEARKEFYGYLKERNIYEDMTSVHSKTLNAFYKQELEIAMQDGIVDFKIPGLEEPYYKQSLSFKRK